MAKQKKEIKEESLEKSLWKAADKLRKNIDAAEYKHIVLGLIFLKYISDSFEQQFAKLQAGEGEYAGADPEDKDEYSAENIFFVPQDARWSYLQSQAKQPEIGKMVDAAMDAIEAENASLKGVLPKVFARDNLDPASLGQLIDLVGNIALGDAKSRSADVLGHVFEYFLGEFALAEGKQGGQFYTPRSVVELLVEMLEPYNGRVFDPCCGSGGMFVQSEKFVADHQGRVNDISIYGQESNQTTWRLAKMNLAIRGIDSSKVLWNNVGSFLNDAHKDLKADYIIANPPFNDSDWSGQLLRTDGRWAFGVPPASNANFAWIQHFIFHLAPKGKAAFIMHGGAASNKSNAESIIRENIIKSNMLDCIVALPTQLFFNTTLPVHIWIFDRNKSKEKSDILMIDAYELGEMVESTRRTLNKEDIFQIKNSYFSWKSGVNYSDEVGFCKSVSINEIVAKSFIVAPNRYVKKPKKLLRDDFNNYFEKQTSSFVEQSKRIYDSNILKLAIEDKYKAYSSKTFISNTLPNPNWEYFEIKDVVLDIVSGNWGNAEPKKNNIPVKVIRGTDLPNIPLFNLNKTPTRFLAENKVDEIKLKPFDLVIEMSGGSQDQPTGRIAMVSQELIDYFGMPLICSNFCKVLRLDLAKVDPFYFYYFWQKIYLEGLTTRYENQPSGIKNFQLDELLSSELIKIPSISNDERIDNLKHHFNYQNQLAYSFALSRDIVKNGFEYFYDEIE